VAVLPPYNHTGEPLLISSSSFWEPDIPGAQRQTVAEVLSAEVRQQLERRGFITVAPEVIGTALENRALTSREEAATWVVHSQLAGNALYIEIKRWEADIPSHPRRILVALHASFIEAVSGHIVWTTHLPLHPIPTPGVMSRWVAYMIAARKAAEELLAPLGPARPAS
jgi:hypothetical protein